MYEEVNMKKGKSCRNSIGNNNRVNEDANPFVNCNIKSSYIYNASSENVLRERDINYVKEL